MALKRKINKAAHDKLSDELKAEYKKGATDDEFILETEGDEDTGALKRAKDREAELRRVAEEKLATAQAELDSLTNNDAKKKGDIKTLEASWQTKLDKQKGEYETKIGKLTGFTQKSLVDGVATALAHKISKAPALLLPHIRARLAADFDGDEPTTRVLDAAGKPSALTVADLEKELVGNKDFAAIIIGSKASGGSGSASSGNGGGAPNPNATDKPVDLSKLTPQQMAEHVKTVKSASQ